MLACLHYGKGRADKAAKIGPQYEDVELGFVICDTGLTLSEFEELPRRLQTTLRTISRAKRVLEQSRML